MSAHRSCRMKNLTFSYVLSLSLISVIQYPCILAVSDEVAMDTFSLVSCFFYPSRCAIRRWMKLSLLPESTRAFMISSLIEISIQALLNVFAATVAKDGRFIPVLRW